MKQGKSAKSDPLRWKKKFLKNLEEQERNESSFQNRIDLLRRGLVGVSLAGDGLDPDLDKELDQLRSTLRSEDAEKGLNVLLDSIEKSVLRLDVHKDRSSLALERAISLSITQLQEVDITREIKRKIKNFSRTLPANIEKNQTHTDLIADFLDLLRMVVRELNKTQNEGSEATGFWQRLFGKQSNSGTAGEQTDLAEEVTDQSGEMREGGLILINSDALDLDVTSEAAKSSIAGERGDAEEEITERELLEEEVARDESVLDEGSTSSEQVVESAHMPEPGFSSIANHVESLLLRIIENIYISEQSANLAESIKEKVNRGLNWYEFVSVLDDISTVILSSFGEERTGFQDFLNDVNNSLEQVQEFVLRTKDHAQVAKDTEEKLDQDVRDQVTGMADRVKEADDLEELKVKVQGHLSHILSSMDKFKLEKRHQETSAALELKNLEERMSSMEKESLQVRLHLEMQQQQAMKDVLTELPNRAAYDKCVNEEYRNWKARNESLCLVMADVDNFKNINDTYGHLAGDRVLKILAGQIASRIRKTDFVARYGGEEFVIIMSGTEVSDALLVIEKLRQAIEKCPFHFKKKQVQVTMSFGIASFEENDSIESVFVRADEALYKAKNGGRNRSCVATRNVDTDTPDFSD